MSSSLSARLTRLLMGGAYGRESRPDLNFRQINIDVLSGLTVSLALVPEAVAFAFVAGVAPLVGLYAAFIVGLITAVFGGRPGMISGATGALAVVMVALVSKNQLHPYRKLVWHDLAMVDPLSGASDYRFLQQEPNHAFVPKTFLGS